AAQRCHTVQSALSHQIAKLEEELVIVPGANHVDLYDNAAGKIPFAKFEQFFKANLK
ncbi:LysR family transcriptional regulator, partial [Serratia sp. CY74664]|uniref:LysR family transcriptional regulator n=1 Tax=Serratia sp. CY74664 TaxID=3383676 RepID=UPI003FA134AD